MSVVLAVPLSGPGRPGPVAGGAPGATGPAHVSVWRVPHPLRRVLVLLLWVFVVWLGRPPALAGGPLSQVARGVPRQGQGLTGQGRSVLGKERHPYAGTRRQPTLPPL